MSAALIPCGLRALKRILRTGVHALGYVWVPHARRKKSVRVGPVPRSGRSLSAETTDVVVVGAGPAGLAVAACLGKVGLDFIILERKFQVASSWRRHYERLHLHTIKQLSSLPYFPYPKNYPRYVPRNLLIEHLDRYAAHFDLRPRFGENVRSVRRNENGWIVEGTSCLIHAPHVVIASGLNTEPVSLGRSRGREVHGQAHPQRGLRQCQAVYRPVRPGRWHGEHRCGGCSRSVRGRRAADDLAARRRSHRPT